MSAKNLLNLGLLTCLAVLFSACGGGGGGEAKTSADTPIKPQATTAAPDLPSYYSNIRNILDAKCTSCHREDGLAPFPLTEIAQVSSMRSAMIYVVESGSMPPVGYAPLNNTERELLLEWLQPKDLLEGKQEDRPNTAFTWWRDSKAIIEQRCGLCHVKNGLAPFPLQNYQDVLDIRAAALHSIQNNTMPPWNPSSGYTPLRHDWSLQREEKAILVDWLAGGAPEGAPTDQRQIETTGLEQVEWEFSLSMPQAYAPEAFPDEYRCFVVEWPKTETRYITASSFRPKFPEEIHHVFVTIIPPQSVEQYKAAEQLDNKPGYSCFGDTRIPGEIPTIPPADVLGWGPGINSKRLPEGTGIQIEPGSALALQIHFNTLTSEPLPERSEMVFVTTPEVDRPGATAYILDIADWVFAENMLIPAGEDNVSFSYEMPVSELKAIYNRPELGVGPGDAIAIHRASLHMHTLGKSGRLTLMRADGSEQVIIDTQKWDFDWQNKYLMQQEVTVYPEDVLRTQCVYDNTEDNQPVFNGKTLPMKDVNWGDGTTDEMCASTLFFTRAGSSPRPNIASVYIGRPEVWQRFTPGALMPIELRLNNFNLEPIEEDANHIAAPHTANTGHYHIYFDSDDDSSAHITDWRRRPVIRVPDDMAPGIHRLRVSLRSANHQPLGVEDSIEFRVVNKEISTSRSVPLIDHKRWHDQTESEDPFADHRPGTIDCPPSTHALENGALEIETGVCNYLSLTQTTLAGIKKGEPIRMVLWHQQLRTEEPGKAHVALAIGGEALWQKTAAIPSDGGFFDVSIESPRDFPAGSTLDFHLHNHGFNSWTLLLIEKQI